MVPTKALRGIGAVAVAISGYAHYRLYFDLGYRSIDVDRVLGINLSRSIALQFLSAAVIALVLLASLRWERLATPAALVGVAFSIGSLVAYALTRTSGLLGFTESRWTPEARLAVAVEAAGAVVLAGSLALARSRRASAAI